MEILKTIAETGSFTKAARVLYITQSAISHAVRELEEEKIRSWEEMSLEDHLEYYMKGGMDKKEAMKAVAKDRGVSRREIYQQTLK